MHRFPLGGTSVSCTLKSTQQVMQTESEQKREKKNLKKPRNTGNEHAPVSALESNIC